MSKSHRGGSIIFATEDKILLLKRKDDEDHRANNHWDVAGGGAETGETPQETAMREALEECGTTEGKLFYEITPDENEGWEILFHEADSAFIPKLSEEHSDYQWIELDKINKSELTYWLRRNIDKYITIIKSHIK